MKKQAVIYARYSSDKQTEQSIEGQLRVCNEFAEMQGYEIQREYIDRAMTGTNDNRPSFLQMINDAKNKDFQYIIVYKLDRFSRNTYDSTFYKHKLEQYGVKVVSATEAISDSMEGKLIERILESMAEMYSIDLSQKVKRGMRESALKKHYLGGNPPLGYKVVDKRLVVNEETAPYIKYAFERYAKGDSIKSIISHLTNNNIYSCKTTPFTHNSLNRTFKNKKYLGIMEYDGKIIEDYCPQLIEQELFDKVQEKLAENKQYSAKRKAHEQFVLSGHLFCGYCGSSVIGDSATGRNGTTHSYYSCRAKRNLHKHCELKSNNKHVLEERVITQTIINLLKDKTRIVNMVYDTLNSTAEDFRIKDYENRIKKVDKDIDEVFNQFRIAKSQVLIDKLNKEADELTELKEIYTKELRKIKKLAMVKLSKKEVEKYVETYIELGKSEDIEEKQKFVNTFINVVYIYNNRTLIYLNTDADEINSSISYEDSKKDLDYYFENRNVQNYYYDNNSKNGSDIKTCGLPILISIFW